MEDLFTTLAPRKGTRPMMGPYYDIGSSSMSGGAFNWGSVWSGLKNFGSTVKNYGTKVWNSNTGQALRQKLKDTNLQEKVVDGISAGIHGAVDLARQELDRQLAARLEAGQPPPGAQVEPTPTETAGPLEPAPAVRLPEKVEPPVATTYPAKRPRDEEDLPPPPSYEELYPNGPTGATTKDLRPRPLRPTTRPHVSMVTPVLTPDELASLPTTLEEPPRSLQSMQSTAVPAPPTSMRPSRSSRLSRMSGWENTLNSITGLGVRALKRRRCFR